MSKYINVLFFALLLAGCSEPSDKKTQFEKDAVVAQIAKLESVLVSEENKALNLKEAKEIIAAYLLFAKELPLDPATPEYLFKAAEVNMGLGEYAKAEGLFNRIYSNYQNFDKRVECLYLTAFINDAYVNQKGKAQGIYEKVIENHQDHRLAQDAKGAIEILTLSDEELIKMLEAKNKQQPAE